MEVLKLENVSFAYDNGHEVLKEISLVLTEGEQVALIGANGVGKSTLLKLFVGLLSPQSGHVFVSGLTVGKANLVAVRRAAGYVFQDAESQLFLANVWEDVAFGPRNEGLVGEDLRRRVDEALSSVGLTSLAAEHVYRLSGGQKRLASIATVLALRPDSLLLDEPTLALDPRNRRAVIRALSALPCAKLIATHDLDFVLDACTRVLLMDGGQIVADGRPDELLRDRALLERHGLEIPLSLSRLPKMI